jgi:hypothetical protein
MWIRSGWLHTSDSWLAESEMDGSPNKGAEKKLKVLADALDRTINLGHPVQTRYKNMFGGEPLEDLDMMEHAHDVVASAKKTPRKPSTCRSPFAASEQEKEPRFLRVRLLKIENVDAALQYGNLYTPEEATRILLDFTRSLRNRLRTNTFRSENAGSNLENRDLEKVPTSSVPRRRAEGFGPGWPTVGPGWPSAVLKSSNHHAGLARRSTTAAGTSSVIKMGRGIPVSGQLPISKHNDELEMAQRGSKRGGTVQET